MFNGRRYIYNVMKVEGLSTIYLIYHVVSYFFFALNLKLTLI